MTKASMNNLLKQHNLRCGGEYVGDNYIVATNGFNAHSNLFTLLEEVERLTREKCASEAKEYVKENWRGM